MSNVYASEGLCALFSPVRAYNVMGSMSVFLVLTGNGQPGSRDDVSSQKYQDPALPIKVIGPLLISLVPD